VHAWLEQRWPRFAAVSVRANFEGILAARLLAFRPSEC